jgi:hypothetical protein
VLGHPSASAAGTEAAPLARESDDAVESAAGAGGAGEASREVSAADQFAQLSEDEARQRLACGFTALGDRLQVGREERRQELPPRLVEQRVSGGDGLAERHTRARRTGRYAIYLRILKGESDDCCHLIGAAPLARAASPCSEAMGASHSRL